MKQKLGVGLSEQPPHGSASVPNTGAPSLANAKRLAEQVAGRQAGRRAAGVSLPAEGATCCSCLRMPSVGTRWQHPSIIPSGDLAQAKVKLIALRYSHCNGAINS